MVFRILSTSLEWCWISGADFELYQIHSTLYRRNRKLPAVSIESTFPTRELATSGICGGFYQLSGIPIQKAAAMCHQDHWRNMCDCQYNYCRDHRGREPCPNEVVNANDPLRPVYEPKGVVVQCAHPNDPSYCSLAEGGVVNDGLIHARADPHGRDCLRCMLAKAGVAYGRDGRRVKWH